MFHQYFANFLNQIHYAKDAFVSTIHTGIIWKIHLLNT